MNNKSSAHAVIPFHVDGIPPNAQLGDEITNIIAVLLSLGTRGLDDTIPKIFFKRFQLASGL